MIISLFKMFPMVNNTNVIFSYKCRTLKKISFYGKNILISKIESSFLKMYVYYTTYIFTTVIFKFTQQQKKYNIWNLFLLLIYFIFPIIISYIINAKI